MSSLDVHIYGTRAATIERRGRRDYRIRYDPEYLSDPDAVPLSTRLPLASTPHTGDDVLRVLEGFLPDRPEVLERWARDAGLPDIEVFGLLRAFGEDVAGAAVFLPSGSAPNRRHRLEPLSRSEIAERIRSVRADSSAWTAGSTDHRFSLGGAQGKFALAFDRDGWHEPFDAAPSTHIFKPGIERYPESDVTEHIIMELARALDLPVANTEMQEFDGERILVVERFDRIRSADGVTRIHQEDFAQAMGVSTLRKYEVDGGPGIEDISGVLKRNADPTSLTASLRVFGASLVFAWLIAHNDGHAKNYSMRLLPGRTELAPLYDLNSYLPYIDPARLRGRDPAFAHEVELAFSIGGARRIADFTSTHWGQLESTLRLPRGTLVAYAIDAADRMVGELNKVLDGLDSRFHSERSEALRTGLFLRRQSALRVLSLG
ncbi:HipA domain-containing protein [Microbacterium sp. NPDC087589]|uniref:HipA domain-containing protein n=1 Tax=Microbacterium sp. NPDC087589 TaxID=3364191 RepID=UPI00381F894E